MRIQLQKSFCVVVMGLVALVLRPAGTAQTATSPNMDEVIDGLSFNGTPLENVLASLAELTGRAILRPQALPTPEIVFDPGGPMTRGDLILAIETVLSLNGIGLSPLGDRFLKVVPLASIRTEAPELVTDSLADRSASGQIVSKLFRLQYLDSQSFQQQIQPFLSLNSIIPFQNSNAVIVTDTVSNLKRLEYVLSEVDKPSKLNIETVFYTLQYAEATEVAQRIQGMIDDARNRFGGTGGQSGGGTSGRTNRRTDAAEPAPMPAPGPGQPAAEGELSMQILFGSNTAITSDERTNQLILMTEPVNLTFFEEIISKLDVKADPSTRIEVIPLKHADATEVASLLSSFVSGRTQSTSSTTRNSTGTRGAGQSGSRTGRTPTFRDTQMVDAPTVQRATAVGEAGVAGSGVEDRDSQFSSLMTIVADERSNALVVSGTRNDLELIGALVDKIDVLLAQVRIEVIIAEVNLNENEGIRRGMDAFGLKYIQNDTNGLEKITLGDGINFLGLGLGGSFNYEDGKVSNLTLDMILNTAQSNDNVKLLSVPTLTTTHNKEASIIVGESRPIVTSSQTSSVTDSTRSSVQYQDIGIELTLTPLIGPNDIIQLEIDQNIDNVAGEVTIDGNGQPIIRTRRATSYVSVANGEMIILGGLQTENTAKGKTRTSFLGEVPLLGGLFSRHRNETTRSELLVFLRPKVIRSTSDVNADAEEVLDGLQAREKLQRFLEEGSLYPEPEAEIPEDSKRNYPKGMRK